MKINQLKHGYKIGNYFFISKHTHHKKALVDINAADKDSHVIGTTIFQLWYDKHSILVFIALKIMRFVLKI